MIFLTQTDIHKRIPSGILTQITNNNPEFLDDAENNAIGLVIDQLSGMYDIAGELDKTGYDRHAALTLWLLSLACYYIYSAVPDNEVPERIIKDYNDARHDLQQVAAGRVPTTLSPELNEDETTKRVTRYGFGKKRSHEIL
ncbi:MAG: phage protein Gp36 family protein [Bacteroidota bacterium]|nr:phage protein Gp36 family protein [Bacteroidota bacterium]